MTTEEMIIDIMNEHGKKIDLLVKEVTVLQTKIYFFGVIGGFLAGIVSSVVVILVTI